MTEWRREGDTDRCLRPPWDRLFHGIGCVGVAQENLAAQLGVGVTLVILDQQHTATVVEADVDSHPAFAADAAVTSKPGLAVAVRTADCLPLLLYDAQKPAVAAVHAGWRGSRAGIVAATVKRLHERFGARPETLHVLLGPAICGACYEVGPEVAKTFGAPHTSPWLWPGNGDRWFVDLKRYNREALQNAGVPERQIVVHPDCTLEQARWPSYRREGQTCGRLWVWIGLPSA